MKSLHSLPLGFYNNGDLPSLLLGYQPLKISQTHRWHNQRYAMRAKLLSPKLNSMLLLCATIVACTLIGLVQSSTVKILAVARCSTCRQWPPSANQSQHECGVTIEWASRHTTRPESKYMYKRRKWASRTKDKTVTANAQVGRVDASIRTTNCIPDILENTEFVACKENNIFSCKNTYGLSWLEVCACLCVWCVCVCVCVGGGGGGVKGGNNAVRNKNCVCWLCELGGWGSWERY